MENKKQVYLTDEQIWFVMSALAVCEGNQLSLHDIIDILPKLVPFYNHNDKIALINALNKLKYEKEY